MAAVGVASGLAACDDVGSRCGGGGPMGDYAFPNEKLRDWVSFFDRLSVVRAVEERASGPRHDSSGVVGRDVTVVLERTLWRRPHSPDAPRRFTFNDWGWSRDDDDGSLAPLRACGETRMEVGRRYLAIVGRHHGEWFPATSGRLRIDGDLAVGGVDDGAASEAHAALEGMSIAEAARKVAATEPYRAAVEHANLGAVARMEAALRDDFR